MDTMNTDDPPPWDAFESISDVARYAGWHGDLNSNLEPKRLRKTANLYWSLYSLTVAALPNVNAAKVEKLRNDSDFQVKCLLQLPYETAAYLRSPGHDFIEQNFSLSSVTPSSATMPASREPVSHSAFHGDELQSYESTSSSSQLLLHVQECHRKWVSCWGDYLAPYTSVIGPSGIGKSFSVKQLATSHGIYVSYVSLGKKGNNGYPPRSQIADVCGCIINSSHEEMEDSWYLYLQVLFHTALCAKSLGISSSDFWDMQVKRVFSGFQAMLSDLAQSFVKQGRKTSEIFVQSFNKNCTLLLEQEAKYHGLEMRRPAPNTVNGNRLQFVLAFDEARSLIETQPTDTQPYNSSAPPLSFRAFRSALRSFDRSNASFALLIDTTSQVANFSPPLLTDLSQKGFNLGGLGCKLFPPFYQFFSLDLFSTWPPDINNPDLSWKTLFSYGRPMFGALIHYGQSLDNMALLTLEKTQPARRIGSNLSKVRYLSQLLYRVSFDVVHQPYAVKLVSAWMHFLVSISDDREHIAIAQPIEPLLAVVAKKHLCGASLQHALVDFKRNLLSQFVSVRDIGEFVASIILLKAVDAIPTSNSIVPLCTPLSSFLVALLGQKVSGQVLEKLATGSLKRLGTGQVFFNRVIQFSLGPPSVNDMFYLYTRCCACFSPPNTTGADILIPVWIPAASETQPAHMGCILVQVKNRANDKVTNTLKHEAQDSIKAAVGYLNLSVSNTPVLGLVLCLRKKATVESEVSVLNGVGSAPIVLAVGLDSSVYPCLADEESEPAPYPAVIPPPLVNILDDLLNIRSGGKVLGEKYVDYVTRTEWKQR